MPRNPVFEVTGDLRCTLVDEKSTFEYIQQRFSERKVPDLDALLDRLEAFLHRAETGSHHSISGGKLTVIVTKVPR